MVGRDQQKCTAKEPIEGSCNTRGDITVAIAWRASQTSPHYMADAGRLLSEIPRATAQTLVNANKIAREMRRESSQSLLLRLRPQSFGLMRHRRTDTMAHLPFFSQAWLQPALSKLH